jgi:hypothetical protein
VRLVRDSASSSNSRAGARSRLWKRRGSQDCRCGAGRLFRKGPPRLAVWVRCDAVRCGAQGQGQQQRQQVTKLLTQMQYGRPWSGSACSAAQGRAVPGRGSLPGLTLRWPRASCGSWRSRCSCPFVRRPGGRQPFPPMASFRARGQIDFRDRSLRGNRDWETHPRAEIGLTRAPARPAEHANRRENVRRRSWGLRRLSPKCQKQRWACLGDAGGGETRP